MPETNISGADVPKATIVNPMTRRLTPRLLASPADPQVAREPGRSVHEAIRPPDHSDETHDNRGNVVGQRQGNLSGKPGQASFAQDTASASPVQIALAKPPYGALYVSN